MICTLSNNFCTLSAILDIPILSSAFVILVSDNNIFNPGSIIVGIVEVTVCDCNEYI